ncbi:MAG: hypothetical protein QOI03_632 [Solirubrobacteraceae bacterium]|nr:hypothetical protein [Solirubrobacteraceae bacterium]
MEDRPLALSCVALLIAAGVSLLMAQAAGFHRVRTVLAHGMPAWLALIVGARVVSYAGYAAAHRSTVAQGTDVPARESLKMVAFGAAATSLGGGFSVDRRALRGAGASPREATVKVLNLGALEFATLAPAACVCAFALLGARHVDSQVTVPWAVGVPVGFALALAAASRYSPRSLSRRGRLGRAAARAVEALELLGQQLRHPLANAWAWLGMALYWAGEIVSLWAALRAFGVHAQLPQTILAYATGHVLTPRSVPLSGVGITEVLLPLALVWVGVALASAVVAVFAYRIVLLSLSIPPALLARGRIRQLVTARARTR